MPISDGGGALEATSLAVASPSPSPSPADPSPVVNSVSPSWGSVLGGQSVSVTGSYFKADARVFIGLSECGSVSVVSANALNCTVAAGAESAVLGDTVTVVNTDALYGTGGSFRYVKLPSAVAATNLKVWLKADALALSDGDAVSTWTDSSGNNNPAFQGVTSRMPEFRTNVLGDQPVIRFDGVNDLFSVSTTGVGSNFSVLILAARALTTSDMHVIEPDCGGGCEWIYPAGASSFRWDGTSVVSPAFNTLAFSLIFLSRSGTTGSVRINGSAAVSGTVGTGRGSQLILGRRNVNLTEYFNGDVAEILVYDKALSDSERQSLEKYLNAKYALNLL